MVMSVVSFFITHRSEVAGRQAWSAFDALQVQRSICLQQRMFFLVKIGRFR